MSDCTTVYCAGPGIANIRDNDHVTVLPQCAHARVLLLDTQTYVERMYERSLRPL